VKINSVNIFKIAFFFIVGSTLLFSNINRLEKLEIKNGELHLHFSDAYDKKQIHHFRLKKPYREVFDFKNTHLAHRYVGKNLQNRTKKSLRVAQYKRDIVRVVIESSRPYICNAYQPLFSRDRYNIPLPKTLKSIKNSKKALSKLHKDELVVIDAGHGGHDTGAIAGGKREKDLVLMIAKRLEKELKKRGYPVYMTRRSDRFLKLKERTRIADKKNAVVFISIHANSVAKKYRNKVYGVETFFLQNTKDKKSQLIAERENRAVLKGTSKLSRDVIIDSVLNGPKIVQSNKLAIDVQRGIIGNLRGRYRGIKDGGVRHAPFWVLVGASRPSILVEVGYISHPKERKRLFTLRYQELIAKGIAEGIDRYLNNRRREIDF